MLIDFTPFFQLSAGLNLTYTASKQFRDVIKKGFLEEARDITNQAKNKIDEIEIKYTVSNDTSLKPEVNEGIKLSVQQKVESFEESLLRMNETIDNAQGAVSNRLQPIYIIASIFSIYVLLLAGMESYTNNFPSSELFYSLIGIIYLNSRIIFTPKNVYHCCMRLFSLLSY